MAQHGHRTKFCGVIGQIPEITWRAVGVLIGPGVHTNPRPPSKYIKLRFVRPSVHPSARPPKYWKRQEKAGKGKKVQEEEESGRKGRRGKGWKAVEREGIQYLACLS